MGVVLYLSIAVRIKYMSDTAKNKKIESLFKAILALENTKEAKMFLRDLLTPEELVEFGNRWQAAQMLSQKISYTTIRGKTGLSPRTIARISKWLKRGMGGYKLIINRFAKHHQSSIPLGKGLR